MAFTLEQCIARPCGAMVGIVIDLDGGLPKIAADGYSGLTDDGYAVCRDHFCPICGHYHHDEHEFEVCEFNGRSAPNLTLPNLCRDPYKVLAAFAR